MWLVRAQPSLSTESRTSGTTPFPADLVSKAATRVGWMGALCAIITVLMVTIQRFSQPEMAAAQETSFFQFNILLLFVGSVAVACIQRFGMLNVQAVIHLGLLYE